MGPSATPPGPGALADILDLPQEIKKSDFVVQLTDGVAHPDTLLRDYAVTPKLVDAFDAALKLCRGALRDRKSSAAYVHGSFGSGKSHFMAVLSLILGGDRAPWGYEELHGLLAQHEWVKEKKLLRLHLNMAAAPSIDEKIFPEYLARVGALHPDAPIPALFADQALFDNAESLRARLGDEAFFAALNGGRKMDKRWGTMAAAPTWTQDSFDDARSSADPDTRARLFSALVRTHFPAFAEQTRGFLDIDHGLGVMARHASQLGYHGVVLFFDELILWLSTLAGDRVKLNAEVQKLSKLVDAQDSQRTIPLISFVARQRDIAELVGDDYAGADAHILQDALRLWEGRFGRVDLSDSNLPAIIEKRVVRPKPGAKKLLEDAFTRMRREVGAAWATLLGDLGDEKAFRQVYPFSPALVEALVCMSHYLQRQRTALKLLMELLTEHLLDFEVGKVVPIGDLYDVLAGSEEPMDGAMRERFSAAKRLYLGELLPVIQEQNHTTTAERCQRLREDHPATLGCSNCPERRCRADNRLVKTLLLAALVPGPKLFHQLTVSRLVQLNHGTLRVPVPGAEPSTALARLRDFGAVVGKLRVKDGGDPEVSVRLEGVDLKPILDQARSYDNPGNQRRKLQELLYGELDVEPGSLVKISHLWRNTPREGLLHFGNVREFLDADLRSGEQDFKVIIDYPFDEHGHSPGEDEARLEKFREKNPDSLTLVWLPSFFSDKMMRELGELVVVDMVLQDTRKHLGHLRTEDQQAARLELENLSSQKRHLLKRALDAAYGLREPAQGDLDQGRSIERHFHALHQGVQIRNSLSARLRDALDDVVRQLLDQRYPRHPSFPDKLTRPKLERSLAQLRRLCEAEGQRLPLERGESRDFDVCQHLGLVTATEGSALLQARRFQDLDNELRKDGVETPAVGQVKRLLDREDQMGLLPEVMDFLVLCYAAYSGRELLRGRIPLKEPPLGKLPDDVELVRPPLPEQTRWQLALTRAGKLFGISVGGRALNARNLRELGERLREAREAAEPARSIAGQLVRWGEFFEGEPPRLRTAKRVAELLDALAVEDPVALVDELAALEPATSEEAMARHLVHAEAVQAGLADDLVHGSFDALRGREEPAAKELLAELLQALEADELQEDLSKALRQLALKAQRLRPLPPPPPAPPEPPTGSVRADPIPPPPPRLEVVGQGSGESWTDFAALRQKLEERLREAGPGAELRFSYQIVRPKR